VDLKISNDDLSEVFLVNLIAFWGLKLMGSFKVMKNQVDFLETMFNISKKVHF
jgi:hypothetical protein